MAAPLFARTPRPSLLSPDGPSFICQSCRRNKSSFRRQQKALRVKPDPSFAPSKTEPHDHIIFNPPPSAPNVYHTPLKFLPKTDPRRKLHSLATPTPTSAPTPASTTTSSQPPSDRERSLPTRLRPAHEKKYHLGQEQIEEIRKLRAEDPRKWTRVRLAEKFECSQFFVSLCCCAPEIKEERDRDLEQIKKRWGRTKSEAREARAVRKGMWGRDS